MGPRAELVPLGRVERAIVTLRGHKVLLDADLAALYGVETRRLNEQVRRNIDRFPEDFVFRLSAQEFEDLKSQLATSRGGWGGKRKLPFVFTEHGALMAASVLSSPKAIDMSILVVRAFVKLRNILATHRQLAAKLAELERKLSTHDEQIVVLFDAIRELMAPAVKPKRRIGFGGGEGA
ncbi:MAG: ORF6N domain-containing protein [Deltaproteobacteria bacterium]|nr:ORF6N domain-containing protein [Deltaproteobacteria bacterium]